MADRYEDNRGVIQDLLTGQRIDAVTRIFTVKGAVRGNHYHQQTVQWTYVCWGSLLVARRGLSDAIADEEMLVQGQLGCDLPGEAHAWKAMEDTCALVFTRGPRSGENYESDVERLETPLLVP